MRPQHVEPEPAASALAAALNVHRHRHATAPQIPNTDPSKIISASSLPLDETQRKERTWRGYVFFLFLLGIIPLINVTFGPKDTLQQQIERIIDEHPELEKHEVTSMGDALDKILATQPGHKLPGALLSRDSHAHWLMAALSIALFLGIVPWAIPVDEDEGVSPFRLLLYGLFTATIGVGILLTFQYFSACFCIIGIWYVAALSPSAPFGASLLGFILGVGVCEEITKVIPVLWRIRKDDIDWRGCCLIGMASGAGFGIAEGVHYCIQQYNGVVGADIYFVRFLSNVSQHAMLSAAASIVLFKKRKHLNEWLHAYDWVLTMTAIMIVPIVLHGLFNTLLKKDFDAAALGVWAMTFAWLAWLIVSTRTKEVDEIRKVKTNMAKTVKTAGGTRYVGT